MRALVDRHHHALFYSLQLLFEDRLGCKVYTPVGHEWWDEGYWRFGEGYGDDRLAQQFLQPVTVDDHHPDRPIRGITLPEARDLPWTYVVATVQDNQRGFARFAQETGAKYVLQVGNTNQMVDWSLDPLALVSSEVPIRGRGIVYHQEFDAEGTFGYREPNAERTIRSFVNCFRSTPCARVFDDVAALLPEFTFAIHGIDGENIETVADIADLMAGSAFGWHDKIQGDGFGHVIHDWAAIGRPLIGHAAHYKGLMAEPFWQDGITCIDLDRHPPAETAQMVRDIISDPQRHKAMCEAIRAVFDDLVDYDAEGERIRGFLS